MGKANPKAWFPNEYVARAISYKPVGKWERYQEQFKPFFPTWAEAHAWMLEKSAERLKKAQAELKRATAFHAKVKEMTPPATQAAAQQKGDGNE